MKRYPSDPPSADGLRRGEFDRISIKRSKITADPADPSIDLVLPNASGTLALAPGGGGSYVNTTSNQTIGGNKTFTSPVSVPAGDAVNPGLYFGSDTGTGFYELGPTAIALVFGGAASILMQSTSTNFLKPITIGGTLINRVQFGTATHGAIILPLAAADIVAVPFAPAFSTAPKVLITPWVAGGLGSGGGDFVITQARNVGTASFDLHMYNSSAGGAVAAGTTYAWIAFN